jgi:hypothetical protein
MINKFTIYILTMSATGVLNYANAAQTSGPDMVCIPIQEIRQSPAIDNKTILLELNGHKYKRLDLVDVCPGITIEGFSFVTSTDDLCTTNGLRVNETAGPMCMIKDIVDITAEQARLLQGR